MDYQPNPWMILPFGLLLAAMALGPLYFPNGWNKHHAKIALLLGAVTAGYYLFGLPGEATQTLLRTAWHYVEFITLIGSLYVISGGIHIVVKEESTPLANVLFLLTGGVISNLLGTTGASMLLIRPWLRMNKGRVTTCHVVFFIFIVSNIGGCLTPIGDPPLFLGYLRGIPFGWVFKHCWPMWTVGMAFLLTVFYFIDRWNYKHASVGRGSCRAENGNGSAGASPYRWHFKGLWNLVFLAVILGAVFIHHPLFLREGVMLAAAAASYFTTRREVHEANQFNFHPIREVAVLFIGIFATLIPALDWMRDNAQTLVGAHPSPALFFWGSGVLSSFLDNAPTYLGCLNTMGGLFVNHTNGREGIDIAWLLSNANIYLVAISIGSVFFGACTYIGNGPNFMVKAIADNQRVRTCSFLEYIFKWTVPILLPLMVIIGLLFFR